jgi:hypothetical protein
MPSYTLSGRVFFDYNGSGLQEEGEPGIQGVPVYVDSLNSALHATTGADGSYSIPNVPPGAHQVYVQSPTQDPVTAFRYINRFLGWVDIPAYEMNGVHVPGQHLPDTEVRAIDQPINIIVSSSEKLDLPLLQGFLTLPFRKDDYPSVSQVSGFDHDGRVGYVVDYRGDTELSICSSLPCPPGTGDGHVGWDYFVPVGNWVVAATPGRLEPWTSVTGNGIALQASVRSGLAHAEGEVEPMTVCGHLAKTVVEVGQAVCRGQIIAQSGISGTILPHVHFDYLFGPPNPIEPDDYIPGGYQKDPFGVIETVPVNFPFERHSGWTKFNDPQFCLVSLGE